MKQKWQETFSLLVSGDFNVTEVRREQLSHMLPFSLLVSGDFNVTREVKKHA